MRKLFIAFPVHTTGVVLDEFLRELEIVMPKLEQLGFRTKCVAVHDENSDPATESALRASPLAIHVLSHRKRCGHYQSLLDALRYITPRCEAEDFVLWISVKARGNLNQIPSVIESGQVGAPGVVYEQIINQNEVLAEYASIIRYGGDVIPLDPSLGIGGEWFPSATTYVAVSGKFIRTYEAVVLLDSYHSHFLRKTSGEALWGEDLSLVATVHFYGGRVNGSKTYNKNVGGAESITPEAAMERYVEFLAHAKRFSEFFVAPRNAN
jgi:hypothetical protein